MFANRVNASKYRTISDKPFTTNCEKAIISFAGERYHELISVVNPLHIQSCGDGFQSNPSSSLTSKQTLLKTKLKIYRISPKTTKTSVNSSLAVLCFHTGVQESKEMIFSEMSETIVTSIQSSTSVGIRFVFSLKIFDGIMFL